MSEHDPDPLDPEIAALLAADRATDVMPPSAKQRIWDGIEAGLGAGGPSGEGGSGPPASPPAAVPGAGSASLLTHGVMLALGLAAGVGIGRMTAPAPSAPIAPPVLAVAEPVDAGVTELDAPVLADAPTTDDAGATPVAERPARRIDAGPPVEAPTSTLAAERVGLEIARTAVGRSEWAHALEALEAHERDHPTSRLREEREVLWIRALAGAGRRAEAERRAEAFRARYPDSLFLPAIALPP